MCGPSCWLRPGRGEPLEKKSRTTSLPKEDQATAPQENEGPHGSHGLEGGHPLEIFIRPYSLPKENKTTGIQG